MHLNSISFEEEKNIPDLKQEKQFYYHSATIAKTKKLDKFWIFTNNDRAQRCVIIARIVIWSVLICFWTLILTHCYISYDTMPYVPAHLVGHDRVSRLSALVPARCSVITYSYAIKTIVCSNVHSFIVYCTMIHLKIFPMQDKLYYCFFILVTFGCYCVYMLTGIIDVGHSYTN